MQKNKPDLKNLQVVSKSGISVISSVSPLDIPNNDIVAIVKEVTAAEAGAAAAADSQRKPQFRYSENSRRRFS